MAKRAQQESGEGRVTAKSRTMMNLTQERLRSCLLQPHQTRGGPRMDIKILNNLLLTIERGNPLKCQDQTIYKKDYGLSWSSQEWKSGDGEHDRSGKPDENSWDSLQKVAPHREEPLLDGDANSVRYGEIIHDRTVNFVSENLQEQAHFENFVMGSDATEFVNQVSEKNFKHCRVVYQTFNNMENVHGYDIECCDIYGKEFLNYSKCCQES